MPFFFSPYLFVNVDKTKSYVLNTTKNFDLPKANFIALSKRCQNWRVFCFSLEQAQQANSRVHLEMTNKRVKAKNVKKC